jgi:hypothetical protein
MIDLKSVYDMTLLSTSKIYQINGRLYKFLYEDPYSRTGCEQYIFRPLNGQRVKADLKLNRNKVIRNVYEVGSIASTATVMGNVIQLSLF